MPNEPLWIGADDVVAINRDEVAETGEPFSIRSRDGLESAVARPRQIWVYEPRRGQDVAILVAALISGIARNHPFGQGNKRTALTAGLTFAALNGYGLEIDDEGRLGPWVEALVTHDFTEADFADAIRPYLTPCE